MRFIFPAIVASLLVGSPVFAQDVTVGAIKVAQPWVPAPPNAATSAGGYVTITNTGTEPDTLTGGTATIAGRVEVHEMSMDGGVMRMRELNPGLVIKPNETVTLSPGGLHLMLIDLKERPTVGVPIKGTLVFAKAGTAAIEFKVEPFGTRVPGDGARASPAKGSGSGEDTAKGSGSGSGSGSGADSAKGSGSGSGSEAAKGSGSGSGDGQAKGSGSGSGK